MAEFKIKSETGSVEPPVLWSLEQDGGVIRLIAEQGHSRQIVAHISEGGLDLIRLGHIAIPSIPRDDNRYVVVGRC